jgi:hypothetical protein
MKNILEEVMAYVSFILILVGIGGMSFELFKEDGLFERLLGIVWEAQVRQPLLIIPVVGGALVLSSIFLRGGLATSKNGKNKNVFSNMMVYLFMVCGAYYSYQWASQA